MSEAIPPLPNTPSWRGAQLKHGNNFTSYVGRSALCRHYTEVAFLQSSLNISFTKFIIPTRFIAEICMIKCHPNVLL
jgi:hypothetical protein